jgi:geranylgeranylglycerol-phosphate geranylgeranyltransferase
MNLKAVLRLTRIEHSIMLVIAVLAAELIARGLPSLPVLVLSLITPIFISMAAFAINDYFDLKVDKINKKERPLVTGELRPIDALYVTSASLIIGIAASLLINYYAFVIAVIFGALALLYSYRLKGVVLLGNAYIAFSMAIPFIFGSYVVNSTIGANIVLVAAMIFLSGLAREIHGTIRDVKGDSRARNFQTLPRVIGIDGSASLALLLYLIAILISIYLFFFAAPFRSNLLYAFLIAVTDLLLLYTGIGFITEHRQKFYDKSRGISLAAMGIALIAILLAPL